MVRTKPPRSVNPKGRAGRKSQYQSWMAADAEDLVGTLGARTHDLAEYFEVANSTIEYWLRVRPDFARAVRRGRIRAALKVSRALFSRAIGYSHPDVHVLSNRVKVYDEDGKVIEERTEPLLVPITKHYPPESWAAHKYLSIMFRDVWADITKMDVEHTHSGEINIKQVEELSMDQLSDEIKELLFALNMKQLSDAQSN